MAHLSLYAFFYDPPDSVKKCSLLEISNICLFKIYCISSFLSKMNYIVGASFIIVLPSVKYGEQIIL
jgi:hypothetical protein